MPEATRVFREFAARGIRWDAEGYFGSLDITAKAGEGGIEPAWGTWALVLQEATEGNFQRVPTLLRLYEETDHPVLRRLCSYVLGDAGPDSVVQVMIGALETVRDADRALDFCNAIRSRGRLSDVPVLLATYERFAEVEDADVLPVYLSDLLEPEPGLLSDPDGFASLEAYRDAVTARYDTLANALGTDHALVLMGRPFGVIPLARLILDRVCLPYFPSFLRRKFEASTGVDCRSFYRDRELQPLRAATVVESFLESPESRRYEDGIRYFFGRAIPA